MIPQSPHNLICSFCLRAPRDMPLLEGTHASICKDCVETARQHIQEFLKNHDAETEQVI